MSVVERAFYCILAVSSVATMWLPWIGSSFWLDETGTSWVTAGSFHHVVSRSSFEGQTPLYYIVVWMMRRLLGNGEWVLRLPSFVASLITLLIVFRLARRFFDEETAWLATIALASISAVAFAAVDARPYAVGTALVVGGVLQLGRWLDDPRLRDLVLWVVLSTLAVWISYTFAVAIVPQFVYVSLRLSRGNSRLTRHFVAALAVLGLVSLPAAPHLIGLFHQTDIVPLFTSGDRSPPIREVVGEILPASLIGVLLAILFVHFLKGLSWGMRKADGATKWFIVSWTLVPSGFFYVLSLVWTRELFRPRYFLAAMAAAALATGWIARGFAPRPLRFLIATAIVIACIVPYRGGEHRQDWRSAARVVNEFSRGDTPILINSGFPTTGAKLGDPIGGFVAAPFGAYPVRGRMLYLPNDLTQGDTGRLDGLVAAHLSRVNRFILVESFERWNAFDAIEARMKSLGYVGTVRSLSLDLRVSVFDRIAAT